MAPRSDAWFRRVGKVTLTRNDGTQVQGYGAVLPWSEEKGDLWGERSHPLGSFPEIVEARGAKLTQGEEIYRVLRPETVTFGGKRLFERALLERWEEDDGN